MWRFPQEKERARRRREREERERDSSLSLPFLPPCLRVSLWNKKKTNKHQEQKNKLGSHTLYKLLFVEEIWLILPVVICLFQGLSHARLRITAFAGICAWLITSDVICRKNVAVSAVLLDTLAKRQANT